MMHRLFNNSCEKHGEYGPVWGKCYTGENTAPRIAAKFYKAVVLS
jgi:hypothetical protein